MPPIRPIRPARTPHVRLRRSQMPQTRSVRPRIPQQRPRIPTPHRAVKARRPLGPNPLGPNPPGPPARARRKSSTSSRTTRRPPMATGTGRIPACRAMVRGREPALTEVRCGRGAMAGPNLPSAVRNRRVQVRQMSSSRRRRGSVWCLMSSPHPRYCRKSIWPRRTLACRYPRTAGCPSVRDCRRRR